MFLSPNQELTLWRGACRYYRGRMTYAVSDFCEMVIEHWDNLSDRTRQILHKEVKEYIEENERQGADYSRLEETLSSYLGMECDVEEWKKLFQFIEWREKE